MEQLFEKYNNIQLFATKYRGYKLLNGEKFYDYEEFKNKMQSFAGFVMHKFKNSNPSRKDVDIYFFKHDSKSISSTLEFKKILDRYNNKEHMIILITKEALNVYRNKTIKQYTHLSIKNYFHKHFVMEMNKGPLCSKHSILTPAENKALCYHIMAHGHNLKAIFESDPQNIWIGGEINDIIKIEPYSEITGKKIEYRIVTPASGKVLQTFGAKKKVTTKPGATEDDEGEGDGEEIEEEELEPPEEDYIEDEYIEELEEAE